MILVYNKIPKKEILKEARQTIPKIEKWFEENPKRKTCHVKFWYGKMAKIRKGHVKEDIDKAAKASIR